MTPRRLLPILGVLVAGCAAGSLTPQQQQERCATFANTVAEAQLRGTPDGEVARRVADELDAQLSRLGSPAIHSPAVRIHGALHNIAAASKRGNQKQADAEAAKARETINEMAIACDLPSSRWLDGPP